MAIDFKSPEAIATEYLLHLKALKPSVNDKQTDNDWFIKSQCLGGIVSGAYADIRKISDDAFPQSARREAVEKHLFLYLNDGFKQPTEGNGIGLFVGPSGATGGFASAGTLTMAYVPNGNTYVNLDDISILAASGATGNIRSVGTGQVQNLLEGALLNISSPPVNIDPSVEVFDGPIADGRDVETTQEAVARVLARVRESIRGGTEIDYRQWAIEADDSVVDANVLRYPQGFGSVGVIITAGTTDIDGALDRGEPIVLVPSDALVELVAAYLETKRPLTDYVIVYKPYEELIDVTVRVRFVQGDGDTILSGQTLTQRELVQREVSRAIYKTPPGGRQFGASGYVVKSEIDEVIDLGLSASPHTEGILSVLLDRQTDDLAATGANRLLLKNQIPVPGVINVIEL